MKRHIFVQEDSLRPEIPFRDLLIFDGIVIFEQDPRIIRRPSSFQLTVYKKSDTVVAIAHEAPQNRGMTIGEGAISIWHYVEQWVKDNVIAQEKAPNIISVQGHNGFYEYVKQKPPTWPTGRIIIMGTPDAHEKYDWIPAGDLQEVLERHLS